MLNPDDPKYWPAVSGYTIDLCYYHQPQYNMYWIDGSGIVHYIELIGISEEAKDKLKREIYGL